MEPLDVEYEIVLDDHTRLPLKVARDIAKDYLDKILNDEAGRKQLEMQSAHLARERMREQAPWWQQIWMWLTDSRWYR